MPRTDLFVCDTLLAVYDDMKEKTLNETQDYGTHRLNTILRGISELNNNIWKYVATA